MKAHGRNGCLILAILGAAWLLLPAVPADSAAKLPLRIRTALEAGRLAEGRLLLEAELRRRPKSLPLLEGLAEAALRQRNYTLARRYYRRMLKLSRRNLAARVGLGKIHLFEGRYREAFVYLQEVVEDDPKMKDARRYLSYIIRARKAAAPFPHYHSLINNEACSRAELAVLILHTLEPFWEPSAELPSRMRTDTLNHWASDSLNLLANHRIVEEFPNSTLEPDAPTSRNQVAWALYQAAKKFNAASDADGQTEVMDAGNMNGSIEGAADESALRAIASPAEDEAPLEHVDERSRTYEAWKFVARTLLMPFPNAPADPAASLSCREVEQSMQRLSGFLSDHGVVRRRTGQTP